MEINKLIDKHQACIEILEAIRYYKNRKNTLKESINGFPGTFPELRKKYIHDIDIANRCIKRLKERHNKILNEIHINLINKYEITKRDTNTKL